MITYHCCRLHANMSYVDVGAEEEFVDTEPELSDAEAVDEGNGASEEPERCNYAFYKHAGKVVKFVPTSARVSFVELRRETFPFLPIPSPNTFTETDPTVMFLPKSLLWTKSKTIAIALCIWEKIARRVITSRKATMVTRHPPNIAWNLGQLTKERWPLRWDRAYPRKGTILSRR